jgi:enterochelin esterase-like enzyme
MSAVKMIETVSHLKSYVVHAHHYTSEYLDRDVKVDIYMPQKLLPNTIMSLLVVNDGQDLPKMPFAPIIDDLYSNGEISPLMVVAIHCSEDRRLEYGTADVLDYMNRGSRAKYHRKFLLKELIPFIRREYYLPQLQNIGYAGFSLGGLSAIDVAWKHPDIFNLVGVFSGSLWWRVRDLNEGYDEATDRVMHKLVREGTYAPNLKFFFETGTLDETMDRNHNGIIDSIDDTLDLIKELVDKGYDRNKDIHYLELADGKHDVPTWARAFPDFLKWGWGVGS